MSWILILLIALSSSVSCSDYPSQSKGKKCSQHFVAENDQIILTKKSEENGAQFLKTFSSSSVDECHSLCCENEQCSVAVYENKGQHLCYLFNCRRPNVCSFMKHANYVTLRKDTTHKANKTHKAPPKKRTAALGERCDADAQCSEAKSSCSQGRCACSEGFIQKNAKCVKSVCPKPDFQFQCDDLSKSPSCIAIYDTCNGIAQCGDGSDEKNCVATLWHSGSKAPSPSSSTSSSSASGLPANRVINLSGKGPATAQPPRQHVSQEHRMAASKGAPPLPSLREKVLHRGRQDPGPPPPAPKKSFAENELQARIISAQQRQQQQQQRHRQQQQQQHEQQQQQRKQQRVMRPPPLQTLIDQGYKKVHLPADQLRSSPPNNYWPDEGREEGSSPSRSDWSQSAANDYYYEPYLRSSGQASSRDLAELFGDRYVDDYNQALYQAPDYGSKSAARELALKQQRQQLQQQQQQRQQQQQQYLDMWARRGGEKREEPRRRPRPPFPARDMFSPNSADPGKTEASDLGSSEIGPSHPDGREAGASRRHNLPDKPPPRDKTAKKEKKPEKSSGSGSHKSSPGEQTHTGKVPVTIFANATSVHQAAKSSKPADSSASQRTQVTSEYVSMLQKSYQQSKIAVVVLGLTLAVTGMALTFFVCRIRRIKNRLRRGKALTSDEADYLINGMYL